MRRAALLAILLVLPPEGAAQMVEQGRHREERGTFHPYLGLGWQGSGRLRIGLDLSRPDLQIDQGPALLPTLTEPRNSAPIEPVISVSITYRF